MAEKIFDVIIIGGGPGGYTAALYCARAGLSTVVLEKFSPGGQMATTDTVDNYPGFEKGIEGFDLGARMQASAERYGVNTEFAEVTRVELNGEVKTVHTPDGDFQGRALILALGAAPRELGLPEERNLWGRGIAYCATCDGMLYKGKDVVVVGGGNTAVEDAMFLAKICQKVTLLCRGPELTAQRIYLEALPKYPTLTVRYNAVVKTIQAERKVTGVLVQDKKTGAEETLPCSGVFVAIGRVPTTDMFKDLLTLDKAGYIIADETTRTNLPGVFAVGDIRTKPLRQIITAAADGAMASKFAEEYLATLK